MPARPLLVTSEQARRLPRWILLLLCTLYITAGLFGREPWRVDDAVGFGIAHTMAHGTAIDWLIPNVHGALAPDSGPLPFWLGAAAMKLTAGLNAIVAATGLPIGALDDDFALRSSGVFGIALAFVLFWYGTHALARRPEIQPDDPFGATASPRDFGRAIADTSLLAALATIGLVSRVHETTALAVQVVWIAAYFYGMSESIKRPVIGGIITGLCVGASLLTTGIGMAVAMTGATLMLSVSVRSYRFVSVPFVPVWIGVAALSALAWPAALWAVIDDPASPGFGLPAPVSPAARALVERYSWMWLGWQSAQAAGPTPAGGIYYLRNAAWFFWPLWPFVMRGIWRWRIHRLEPLVAVPLVLGIFLLILAVLHPAGGEEAMLPLILPLAILTALALPTIPRGIVSLVDWFAIMAFSIGGLFFWSYWIAFMTGFPPRMARAVRALVPGFEPELSWMELLAALLATFAWIVLTRWRLSRPRRPFWAPIALSAGGTVLLWFLLMTLWLPAGNYRKTYRNFTAETRQWFDRGGCVDAFDLDRSQRALFAYYGHARFGALPLMDDPRAMPLNDACPWLLVSDRASTPHDPAQFGEGWRLVWQGQPPVNRGERLFLYGRGPLVDLPVPTSRP